MFSLLEAFFTQYGYLAVFVVLVACGFGVPIPEDVTLVTGGVIAGLGHANVHTMFLVGMAGVLVGDGLMFTAGRIYGHKILNYRFVQRVMTPQRYAQVQDKFDKYGNRVLFVARFLPGLRTPIYITAGISGKVSYWQFLLMDGLAAMISVPIWVYLGSYGAENIDWLMHKVHQFQTGVYVVIGVGAAVLLYYWWKKRQRVLFFRRKIAEIRARRAARKQQKTTHL
ncbi:DedA family protein [Snodgrassella sp. CFCC 13594]|uniref:DedA family protein n=1 Tax=Snodgrassella sp. CFCC 13594 TaxID=1775559 RepID=UPI00083354FA|nr:DedA family protein [Snodgrassella sp. CFCC 13594]